MTKITSIPSVTFSKDETLRKEKVTAHPRDGPK